MTKERLKNAMTNVRPALVGVAMGASLLASSARQARAEGMNMVDELGALERAEVEALQQETTTDVQEDSTRDTISATLEEARTNPNPDFLPGGGDAATIVWNQTANWIVAVDKDGEPVYMPPPDEFQKLDVETMGSLKERYRNSPQLLANLEGETINEKIKNDRTKLVLGQVFQQKNWAAVAQVIRHDGFNVPVADYKQAREAVDDEYGYDYGQQDDQPSFVDRALGEVEKQVKDQVQEETGLNLDFLLGGGRDR